MRIPPSFGHWIKTRRLALGKNQQELKHASNLSKRQVIALEKGQRWRITDDVFSRLAVGLELSESALYEAIVEQWKAYKFHEDDTVYLGEMDTKIMIVDGNGRTRIEPHNLMCQLDGKAPVSDDIAAQIQRVELQQALRKAEGLSHAWNGPTVRIGRFQRSSDRTDQDLILQLHLQEAQYFHFLVTAAQIFAEFEEVGFASPTRERLVGAFSAWRTETPPDVVSGLPLNLMVVTADDMLVFSRRSADVAVAPNVLAATVNENLHPIEDRIEGSNCFDVEGWVARALDQELGWIDSEHTTKAEINLLALCIDIRYAMFGVLGYVRLSLTFDELRRMFARVARDRFEFGRGRNEPELTPVPLSAQQVCHFIHANDLYNIVGVNAFYTMVHNNLSPYAIDKIFNQLQETPEDSHA